MNPDLIYNGGQIFSLLFALAVSMFLAKYYGIGRTKAFLINVISQIVCFAGVFILTWMENGFQRFGEQNAVRVYPFLVLIALLDCKLFKVDFLRCMDYQSITMPLIYGVGHFACLARMCCFGFHYQEGSAGYAVAHALTGTDQLPMQIFESVSSLLVFAIVIIVAVKTRFKVTGYLLAICQILFGGMRFFWEFLRDNNKLIVFGPMNGAVNEAGEQAVWGISNLAFWALAIFAAGVILFVCLKIYHSKESKTQMAAA